MDLKENVSLSRYSAMRLGGTARYAATAYSEKEIPNITAWAKEKQLPFIVIGEGSNIIWRDEGFNGLIIINRILGRQVLSEDSSGATIRVGAGEHWDTVVERTVSNGWSGLEFLSAIPGTAGAGPVQNIGAYGQELSQVLVEIEAWDNQLSSTVKIPNAECGFAYRTSRFKTNDKGRFVITHLTLKLSKTSPVPPFYESLQNYLDDHGIRDFSPKNIREAVVAIRKEKLPDPSVVANNGSFFTNPIIDKSKFDEIKAKFPEVKDWPMPDGKIKISAGWLVEQAGFTKDIHDSQTGMATWRGSALVLVNERAQRTTDLLAFKQKIVDKVQAMFGISLEQEPELLPQA